jgi:hypothetical protein
MILENNPDLDVEALTARIDEIVAEMPDSPDTTQLSVISYPTLLTRLKFIENGIKQCAFLVAPRTSLPSRLDRFPFNRIPFFTRLVLAIDYLLFARQRESMSTLSQMIGLLVDTQRDLAGDLQQLAKQIELLKKSNDE